MQVRPLVAADAPFYVALRGEMLADSPWAFGSSPEDDTRLDVDRVARSLREAETLGGYAIVGAWEGRTPHAGLVGCAVVMRDSRIKTRHRADVYSVYVTPACRGRGIGLAIMEEVKRIARSWQGVNSLRLSVSERSKAARCVYERTGFTAWGVEPGCLRVGDMYLDEVHMVCML